MPHDFTLKLPPSEAPPALADVERYVSAAARELRLPADQIAAVRPTRISFDARRRGRGWRVALRAWVRGEEVPPPAAERDVSVPAPQPDAPHVVIIGSGPAGLFCAHDLLAAGLNVTVLERGLDVRERRASLQRLYRGLPADPDSNYCFGEGGAGTYSDGKLYTRSGNKRAVRAVLATLVAHGAPPEILVHWRPHVGSNRLPDVVRSMRETILRSGGSVRFGMRAEEIETGARSDDARAVTAVVARDLQSDSRERFPCDAVVLATGHSALDSLRMVQRAGAPLEAKGFAMGVRVEHPQPWLDDRQYGGIRGECDLPASFYELTAQVEERGVYSFCMCPGGFIVPASTSGERMVVNGMSLSRRDSPFANSGLVVAIEPEDWCGARGEAWGWTELLARARAAGDEMLPAELPRSPQDDPLFGVFLQHALERVAAEAGGGANRAPAQRLDALVDGVDGETIATSYRPGVTATDLEALLPRGMHARISAGIARFDDHLPGFVSEFGQALGVESRTSSPVRVVRDRETLASPGLAGLYPCGEGAGFAGGIISAAIDGKRVAEALGKSVHALD